MNPKVTQEKALTAYEVRELLKDIKKRDGELNFRANKTDEALAEVLKLSVKESEELKKKLTNLNIPRVKDVHIAKIVDIVPKTVDELKVVLQGYTITVNNDNMKKIIDIVKEFLPKKK